MNKFNTALKTMVVFGASFLLFAACGKKDDGGGATEVVTPVNPCLNQQGQTYINGGYCNGGVLVPLGSGTTKTLEFGVFIFSRPTNTANNSIRLFVVCLKPS